MDGRLELKVLARYPFLKESQEYVADRVRDLEKFIGTNYGRLVLNHAAERVKAAIRFRGELHGEVPEEPERAIFTFALARVIVSCIREQGLIERLGRYEAARMIASLVREDRELWTLVVSRIGFSGEELEIPVTRYVDLASGLKVESWRLVNRDIRQGKVRIRPEELPELIREQLRQLVQRQLPQPVSPAICDRLAPLAREISRAYQEETLQQFGEVQESSFPPCMRALIEAITTGRNLPHQGRFALTAFLHTIGLSNTQIVELYRRAPDFDITKTMYQVDHIAGGRGTEYTAPSCATMRTYGICTGGTEVCGRIGHPLRYYLKRKREVEKKQGSGGRAAEKNSAGAHEEDVQQEGKGETRSLPHDGREESKKQEQ